MSAKILEQSRTEMSVIFPTQPTKVKIHTLPKNAEMITSCVGDDLTISAWMPDSFHEISQKSEMGNDDFFYAHCDECSRNCSSFLDNYLTEHDEVDWDHPELEDHCNVYDNGYHGQICPQGYILENSDTNFKVSNMVFQISVSHIGDSKRFSPLSSTAYLRAGIYEDNTVMATRIKMAANVFGTEEYPEGICWGYNEKPDNLRGIVTEYCSTPFNNDLTSLYCFEENCSTIRYLKNNDSYHPTDDEYICERADALIMIDAGEDVTAFFYFLTAGYKSLKNAPHIMLIPVYESDIEKNGKIFNGYVTKMDSVGKSWFLTSDGLLIGQV